MLRQVVTRVARGEYQTRTDRQWREKDEKKRNDERKRRNGMKKWSTTRMGKETERGRNRGILDYEAYVKGPHLAVGFAMVLCPPVSAVFLAATTTKTKTGWGFLTHP